MFAELSRYVKSHTTSLVGHPHDVVTWDSRFIVPVVQRAPGDRSYLTEFAVVVDVSGPKWYRGNPYLKLEALKFVLFFKLAGVQLTGTR